MSTPGSIEHVVHYAITAAAFSCSGETQVKPSVTWSMLLVEKYTRIVRTNCSTALLNSLLSAAHDTCTAAKLTLFMLLLLL
jgi:hypothetical protein